MLSTALTIFYLLLPNVFGLPYFCPNGTTPCTAPQPTAMQPNATAAATNPCQTFYPSELRIMNSRYPDWDTSPLHIRMDMFMLLRQRDDTFQVATRVQFDGLTTDPNTICHLQLQLPNDQMQTIAGPQPIFNVYQVKREAGSLAMWDTYVARNLTDNDPPVFGQVNGTELARYEQWNSHGGLYDIGPTKCNETLTFQMGMAFDGGDAVNFWDFVNVALPATPAQGFRVVTGC